MPDTVVGREGLHAEIPAYGGGDLADEQCESLSALRHDRTVPVGPERALRVAGGHVGGCGAQTRRPRIA